MGPAFFFFPAVTSFTFLAGQADMLFVHVVFVSGVLVAGL